MKIDNTDKVLDLFTFNDHDFYFLQIIKRRKDNPGLERDMSILKTFHINSIDEYRKSLPLIKRICDMENARAYLRVNKRNYKFLAMKVNKRVVEYITSGEYKALSSIFDSVASETINDQDKKWVIDIDWVDFENKTEFIVSDDKIIGLSGESVISKIMDKVFQLQSETRKEPFMKLLQSKNGAHLITRPFNLQKFKQDFPNIVVGKDNPTLIYCP